MNQSPTLATGLSLKHNALNFLRVGGATFVIAVHSPGLAGVGDDPRVGHMQIGVAAVAYFFVISGFLITASRFKLSGAQFAARRFARIIPGLWVCFIVTALVITPIAARAAGKTDSWSLRDALGYAVGHMFFLPGQDQLTGILAGNPNSFTWNGPVWTIPLELLCYTLIGCALAVPALRKRLRVLSVLGLFSLTALGMVVARANPEPGALYFVTCFAVGVVLYAWQDKIPMSDLLAVGCLAIVVVCFAFAETTFLGFLPYGYFVLWFGARAPDLLKRVGARNDISYGVYVYAWPVQQLLFILGVADHGLWVFSLASMAGAVLLGWLSWLFIERRANEWMRGRVSRQRDQRLQDEPDPGRTRV